MTRFVYRLWALFICVSSCGVAVAVYAEDINQIGTITIQARYKQHGIAGGDISVYQVARRGPKGNAVYEFLPAFEAASSMIILSDLEAQNAAYAQALLAYRHQAQPVFHAESIPAEGLHVTGLNDGLYLVVQETAASGYEVLKPFLVTIPKDGNYQIEAIEKMSPLVAKAPTVTPDSPTTRDSELPFTGQVWWPAPLLLALGGAFWVVSFFTKKRSR